MKILAVEFSSAQRSVAVVVRGEGGRPMVASEVVETNPEAAALMMVEEALETAGVARAQVEVIAVGLGPGSYTGIRAALSLAQGWQLGTGAKLIGIGSVESLAVRAQEEGWRGRVTFLIDAQRNECYAATYTLDETGAELVEPLRLSPAEAVKTSLGTGESVAGPEVKRWFPEGRVLFPSAAVLARLAAGRTDFVPGEQLEPIYLRPVAFVKAPPPRRTEQG